MNEEIKKQFFLVHTAGSDEIDYGTIDMSEEEMNKLVEELEAKGGCISEFVDEELGIGNFDSWIKAECSKSNIDTFLFMASAMANELTKRDNTNRNDLVKYCIDILIKAKELGDDEVRGLLEEIGAISKNLK